MVPITTSTSCSIRKLAHSFSYSVGIGSSVLPQFAEKITQSAEALACLMAAATSAVLNVSIIEPFPEVDVSVLPELSASPVELSEVSELAESFAEPSELSVLSPELTVWLPYDGKV